MNGANLAWLDTIWEVYFCGESVAPRAQLTKEVQHHTLTVDTLRPVVTLPMRQLSYSFMAAEAYWIISGDDRVSTIEPYNKTIAQFSDNGETFFGAYGPRITAQLDYVIRKLAEDLTSRQAGLTIWRENPPATKDVPCTVAIFFNVRHSKLAIHVFMRSSDAWLGLPYDIFNFSMLNYLVCGRLRQQNLARDLTPGPLYLTAASRHLYERNWKKSRQCLQVGAVAEQPPAPRLLYEEPVMLLERLRALRDASPVSGLRWWT